MLWILIMPVIALCLTQDDWLVSNNIIEKSLVFDVMDCVASLCDGDNMNLNKKRKRVYLKKDNKKTTKKTAKHYEGELAFFIRR